MTSEHRLFAERGREGLGETKVGMKGELSKDRRLFEPGDLVTSFTGQIGLVLSPEELERAKARLREGKRFGHYFAPGCCAAPDYVTQIPVLFEDGTYDVMKAMNIRKNMEIQQERRNQIRKMLGV